MSSNWLVKRFQPGKAFAAFAGRHHDGTRIQAGLAHHVQKARQMNFADIGVGHHRHRARGRNGLSKRAGLRQQAVADMNGISAVAQARR